MYFMDPSSEIIILLVGGDKKTQGDNIKTRRDLLRNMKMEKLTEFDVAEYLDTDEIQTLILMRLQRKMILLRLSRR